MLELLELVLAPDERRVDPARERGYVVDAARAGGRPGPARSCPSARAARPPLRGRASRTRRSVAAPIRISPAAAACSSRAATLTASPVASVSPRAGDDLAGVDADAHLRARAPRPPSRISTAARTARSASSSWTCGIPKTAIAASPTNFSTVPPWRSRIARELGVVARHQLAEDLRIGALAERRGADEVAEDDRDGLAHVRRRSGQRRASSCRRSGMRPDSPDHTTCRSRQKRPPRRREIQAGRRTGADHGCAMTSRKVGCHRGRGLAGARRTGVLLPPRIGSRGAHPRVPRRHRLPPRTPPTQSAASSARS